MLGLRRYQGVQVDLWQGELERFVHDASIVFDQRSDLELARYPQGHVVLVPSKSVTWDARLCLEFMERLKGELNPTGARLPRRLTLVLCDLEQYRTFQKALFSSFPDV